MNHVITKELVRHILDNPLAREWTLQGFGMLRTYLTKEIRMHVWCPLRAVKGVSTLHTHPWDFESNIIAGKIRNYLFLHTTVEDAEGKPYFFQTIKCGAGGGPVGTPKHTYLVLNSSVDYDEGKSYKEKAEVIHESSPLEGTVTIVHRQFKPDTEHAYVFWPESSEWVSAEPRTATDSEVKEICADSLRRWFK